MKLFRSSFLKYNLRKQEIKNTLYQFTSLDKLQDAPGAKAKPGEQKEQVFNYGRSWLKHELSLKSNDDLHKLWYVLLKEKNSILSDNIYMKRIYNEGLPEIRLKRVEKSMKNIWSVLDDRKKIKEDFQSHLIQQYTEQKKQQLNDEYLQYEQETKFTPQITQKLLQMKLNELQKGKQDTDYIQKYIDKQESWLKHKEYLKKKYDYKKKKVIDSEKLSQKDIDKMNNDEFILKFRSSFQDQYKQNIKQLSQEEILRQHVKNWKDLELKQRRVVVNFLNARRARDAKKEFKKELSLLSQKIAYENQQRNLESSQHNQLLFQRFCNLIFDSILLQSSNSLRNSFA